MATFQGPTVLYVTPDNSTAMSAETTARATIATI
jgi:hypothetical protein